MFSIESFILGGVAALLGLTAGVYVAILIKSWAHSWDLYIDSVRSVGQYNIELGNDLHDLTMQVQTTRNELEQLKRHVLSQGKEDSK